MTRYMIVPSLVYATSFFSDKDYAPHIHSEVSLGKNISSGLAEMRCNEYCDKINRPETVQLFSIRREEDSGSSLFTHASRKRLRSGFI
jgi:hypothetical protein